MWITRIPQKECVFIFLLSVPNVMPAPKTKTSGVGKNKVSAVPEAKTAGIRNLLSSGTTKPPKNMSPPHTIMCEGFELRFGYHESSFIWYKESSKSTGGFRGIFYTLLESAAEECCGTKVSLIGGLRYAHELKMTEKHGNETILLPVTRTFLELLSKYYPSERFIPIFESPGARLFKRSTSQSVALLTAICNAWPVLYRVLILAAFAGIIVWILDRNLNEEQFPKRFLQGFWEGYWWALVTMTTVGYGDKAPRSIPARLFGIVWILVGLVCFSIFTAGLTTALTSINIDTFAMEGSRIAVLKGSKELKLVLDSGGTPKEFKSVDQALDFKNHTGEDVDGILLEQHIALFLMSQASNVKMVSVVPNPAMIGISVRNLPASITDCLHNYISLKKSSIFQAIKSKGKKFRRKNAIIATAKDVFGAYTTLEVIITMSAWLLLFSIILIVDCHKNKISKKNVCPMENIKQVPSIGKV